jgi:hypothetical protein
VPDGGGSRLDPGGRRPTAFSRNAGLALQVALAAVVTLQVGGARGTAEGVSAGVMTGLFLLAGWLLVGRWFGLVVLLNAVMWFVPLVGGPLEAVDHFVAAAAMVATGLVGLLATRLDRVYRAPVVRLDVADHSIAPALATTLADAGFRDVPDLVYALSGVGLTVAAFPHEHEPVYAEAILSPNDPKGRFVGGLVTLLRDGRALETEGRGRLPAGPDRLRQVVPNGDLADMTRRHLETLSWLAQRGLGALPADPASHPVVVEELLEDSAATFRDHPLRVAARFVVLTLLRRDSDTRPVEERRAPASAGGDGRRPVG